MSSVITKNLWRLLLFVVVQAVVLQQVQSESAVLNYISIFIYPLFLFLLPLKIPKTTLVLIGFGLGMLIDASYNSPGVHSAACLVTAFLRPTVLSIFEPREGYNVSLGLTIKSYGILWFLQYTATLLFIHLLIYFILDIFTPVYTLEIILRTIISFIFSLFLMIVYMLITQTKV